uniref:Uncharacterized protein n=1 Tax=Picea glauca TaxID=3330 RepID=A0A101LYQ8_PICGL|nr:hypothetical protein ABT39_MTgene4796 [Picea glauca]
MKKRVWRVGQSLPMNKSMLGPVPRRKEEIEGRKPE